MTPYTIIHDGQDREGWLEARKSLLGASECAGALGVSKYQGNVPLTVYARKVGAMPGPDMSDSMELGQLLEPWVADKAAQHLGGKALRDGRLLASVSHPFIGATPDYWVEMPDSSRVLVECKTTGDYSWTGDSFPPDVWCQVQQQMLVTGEQRCLVAVLCRPRVVYEFHWVERDEGFIRGVLIPDIEDFWKLVQDQTPPQPDGSPGARAAIEALWPTPEPGKRVFLPEEAMEWDVALEQIKAEAKSLDSRREAIEDKIRFAIADADEGVLDDGTIYTLSKPSAKGTRTLRRKGKK